MARAGQWDAGDPLTGLPIETRARKELRFEIRIGCAYSELRDTFYAWRECVEARKRILANRGGIWESRVH